MKTCAKAPCKTCPYRRDVPSGIWHREEYEKLPAYDGDIWEQMMKGAVARFDCHQKDGNLCAGWVAAHGAHNLVALRLARDVAPSVYAYRTKVPLFASGKEAARHGMREIRRPKVAARNAINRLLRKRGIEK